ncbi:MAG: hypothetical protein SF069_19005 [Phycisphaerae bacterium]|nr:hypothetical protein [Phycisphaerae bacterium]
MLAIGLVAAGAVACSTRRSAQHTFSEWKLVDLEQEFVTRADAIENDKNRPRARLELLHRLILDLDKSQVESAIDDLTSRPEVSEFDNLLAQALVESSLRAEDWPRLRLMLESKCPEYVANSPLELALASGKRPEALGVLIDSYQTARNAAASATIIRCLSRAFPEPRRRTTDDTEFVGHCEKWWRENWRTCDLNLGYEHLPSQPPPPPGADAHARTSGLFIAQSP